jgi:methyl-accepting chemotaxis protein
MEEVKGMDKHIFALLEQMSGSIKQTSGRFEQMSESIEQMSGSINQMSGRLDQIDGRLDQIDGKLDQIHEKLDIHDVTLKEHSLILSALRNGLEGVKAELSEMRLQNAKDFGEIKAQLKDHEDSIEILKEESWINRKSNIRIQKTLGLT